MTDVTSKVTTEYVSNGADKAVSDYKKVTAAEGELSTASIKVTQTNEALSRSTISVSRQLDSFTKSLDPLTKAQDAVARGQRLMEAAQREGLTITDAQARAMANAADRVEEMKRALDKHTTSQGLNRAGAMQLRGATSAFIDQVQAGTPVFQAARMQAADFYEALSSEKGGLAAGAKKVGAGLLDLATGWKGVSVGVVGTIAAGVLAANAYVDGQRKMAAALTGTGRAAGLTLGQLNGIAEAGAKAGNISIGLGRELAGTFAHAGIGGATSQALIGSASAYSRATGSTLEDGGKALAIAFADPEKGASELNKSLGFLNDKILTAIHVQEASGDVEGARRTMLTAYLASLQDVTDHTWTLSKAFDGLKASAGDAFGALGKSLAGLLGAGDPNDKLRSLQMQRDLLPARDTFNRDRLQVAINALQHTIGNQAVQDQTKAANAKAKADADALSMQAREVVRALLPEIERNESYQTHSGILSRVIANPSGLTNAGDATRALGMLSAQHTFSDPLSVMQQDAKLALDSINAVSLAQRAAIEARRAELAVMRETGDASKSAAAGQNALNLELARARKEAEDRLVTSQQNLAMVGMTPFQRGLQEIDNRYKGPNGIFAKDSATGSQLAAAMAPVQADLKSAGDLLAQALREIAEKVKAPFLTVDGKPLPSPFGTLGNSSAGAIKAIESGGNYGALGPVTKSGDRAYGAYQVMGANIPSWSRAALGYSLTPSQFLANQGAQDAVFNHQFGASVAKYGNTSDAASVWFTGRPLAQGAGARDVLGTTGASYVGKFNAALSGSPSAVAQTITANTGDAAATAKANQGAYAADRQAFIQDQQQGPIKAANVEIDAQVALLKAQQTALGGTAERMQGVIAAQTLLNSLTSQGVTVTASMQAQITAYGNRVEAEAKASSDFSKQQQRIIDTMDLVRDASKGALSTFVQDLRNGESAGKALQDVFSGITDKVLNLAENNLVDSLFGKSGTSQGGLFGGSLLSLFGLGGSSSAASTATPSVLGTLYHSGGLVGANDNAAFKALPASAWAGAPRYHTGMGLNHDERPAILQTGEAVVSRADLAAARAQRTTAQAVAAAPAGSGAAGTAPIINIHDYGGMGVEVEHKQGPDMQGIIDLHIARALTKQAQTNGAGFQAFAKRMGTGRTG